jgi:hypothetical protein
LPKADGFAAVGMFSGDERGQLAGVGVLDPFAQFAGGGEEEAIGELGGDAGQGAIGFERDLKLGGGFDQSIQRQ